MLEMESFDKQFRILKNYTPDCSHKTNKSHLVETMSKKILKFTKAVYKNLSPSHISILEKQRLRGEYFDLEEKLYKPRILKNDKLSLSRKMNKEGVKILNLPKLPFGRHLNYDEENFRKKHFIKGEDESSEEELRSFDKQFRIQQKLLRKNKKTLLVSPSFISNQKDLFVYSNNAGELKCDKDWRVIDSYDNQKSKFKLMATFNDAGKVKEKVSKMKKYRPKNHKISVSDIQNILNSKLQPICSKMSLATDNPI